jgi:histidinol-phosphatase (PHP family)
MRHDRAEGGASEKLSTGAPQAAPADVRQATDLPLDAHLHTDGSSDADVPIDAYAADAVARRIPELAITDHVDFEPGWPNHAPDVRARERTVREAAERWAEAGLAIRFGVEVTYQTSREEEIREHLARVPYDFVIGSVHVGPDSPYHATRVRGWTAGRSLPAIVAPYFDDVTAAARSGLFDAIGHLDFVKRYLLPYVTPAELAAAPELYAPVLRALVEAGAALEVNTSGLRQAARETYPSASIVALFGELGGTRVSAGSDAHRREALAFGLEEGYAALAEAGFEELAFRRGADRVGDRIAVAIPERLVSRSRGAGRPGAHDPDAVPGAVPNAQGGASL